jgi:hypothetical protein
MRKNCDIPSVEEIENPVLNASLLGPEFVNAVSQEVRGRPPKFVSELLKEFNSDTARGPRFIVFLSQRRKPFNHRGASVRVSKENDLYLWHRFSSSEYTKIDII